MAYLPRMEYLCSEHVPGRYATLFIPSERAIEICCAQAVARNNQFSRESNGPAVNSAAPISPPNPPGRAKNCHPERAIEICCAQAVARNNQFSRESNGPAFPPGPTLVAARACPERSSRKRPSRTGDRLEAGALATGDWQLGTGDWGLTPTAPQPHR